MFLGRFQAWLRAFAPVIAGMAHMPYHTFFFFNAAGGILWAAAFSLLGYFVGNSWDTVKGYLDRVGLFAVVLGMVAVYGYFLLTKKKRALREHMIWIDRRLAAHLPRMWAFTKARFAAGRWYGMQLTAALTILLLAISAFAEIVEDLVDKETLFRLDFTLQRILGAHSGSGVTRIMADLTDWCGLYLAGVTIVALVVFAMRRRAWWDVFALFLAAGGGEGVLRLLKLFFHRPRPTPPLVLVHDYSFPSGHAFWATIAYGALLYFSVKSTNNRALHMIVTVATIFLILFVGVSRLWLNVHWLTDVLAGYAVGTAWLVFSIVVANTLQAMSRASVLKEDQERRRELRHRE